jgi:chromosome segregation ATPase
LDSEQNRQRTLQAQLFDLEAKVRHIEDQLAIARKDQDDLRFSNMGMGDRNNDLRSEIEALQNHCNVLQQQNRDLNIELERFVQTDEQIRATLNRRDRVNDLRHKTENELQKSLYDLERSSPTRSGYKR